MLPERARLLGELLREMRQTSPDYFPDEAWYEIHKSFAIPYAEVVVMNSLHGAPSVLLLQRENDDPHWPGEPWHLPGGIWRVSQSIEEACQSIGMREVGLQVTFRSEVMTLKWKDHAYANPISHVCVCEAHGHIREGSRAKFFPPEELPDNMLIHHRDFVEASFRAIGPRLK